MRSKLILYVVRCLVIPAVLPLSGCQGILQGIYDEPDSDSRVTPPGQLYVDASDWGEWHYIDLPAVAKAVAANPGFNTSSMWETYPVPAVTADNYAAQPLPEQAGIYTYWYDVFGAGMDVREYRGFTPVADQPEPDNWTFAVHRNNVRTNGCGVCETSYVSIDALPSDPDWLDSLSYQTDEWNRTDVWTVQDRMLQGLVGSQGIYVNNTLSRWLEMKIPPMPPAFSRNGHVFVIRLSDGTYAALQLADYVGATGKKCCLTVNYRYPL